MRLRSARHPDLPLAAGRAPDARHREEGLRPGHAQEEGLRAGSGRRK